MMFWVWFCILRRLLPSVKPKAEIEHTTIKTWAEIKRWSFNQLSHPGTLNNVFLIHYPPNVHISTCDTRKVATFQGLKSHSELVLPYWTGQTESVYITESYWPVLFRLSQAILHFDLWTSWNNPLLQTEYWDSHLCLGFSNPESMWDKITYMLPGMDGSGSVTV